MPLYILVSSKTSSAAEAVAYDLQQLKRATIIGEQTHGEANPGLRFVVNDQLYMMIPTAVSRHAVTGTNWEGIGVSPDIRIAADTAFAAAMVAVCTSLQAHSGNDIYKWMLPEYAAQLHPICAEESLITQIIGRYEGNRQITQEQGVCYYISGQRKNRMIYIGSETFMLEGRKELRLKFGGHSAEHKSATVIWNDGSTEILKRLD